MKTSFAKTFFDYSQKVDSADLIFKDRKTLRNITDDDNGSLEPEQVFVLEPYSDSYASQKTSTLLVNKELKKQYDDIWSKVESLKETLIDELKKPSGIRTGIEDEISLTFSNTKGKFINAMKRVKSEVLEDKDPVFDKVQYKLIFNDKVLKFLGDDKLKAELKEYIDRYDELIVSVDTKK